MYAVRSFGEGKRVDEESAVRREGERYKWVEYRRRREERNARGGGEEVEYTRSKYVAGSRARSDLTNQESILLSSNRNARMENAFNFNEHRVKHVYEFFCKPRNGTRKLEYFLFPLFGGIHSEGSNETWPQFFWFLRRIRENRERKHPAIKRNSISLWNKSILLCFRAKTNRSNRRKISKSRIIVCFFTFVV